MPQEDGNVAKHEEVAESNRKDICLALSGQLVLDGALYREGERLHTIHIHYIHTNTHIHTHKYLYQSSCKKCVQSGLRHM